MASRNGNFSLQEPWAHMTFAEPLFDGRIGKEKAQKQASNAKNWLSELILLCLHEVLNFSCGVSEFFNPLMELGTLRPFFPHGSGSLSHCHLHTM